MLDIHRHIFHTALTEPCILYGVLAKDFSVYVYHWFTKGWSIEIIADKTRFPIATIEALLKQYEKEYRDGQNAISAI